MKGSNRIRLLQAKEKAAVLQMEHRAEKVVGYTRVSTEEQATAGHGLDVQERAIRSFCQSQNYELVHIISDAGISGAKRPRTGTDSGGYSSWRRPDSSLSCCCGSLTGWRAISCSVSPPSISCRRSTRGEDTI